MVAERRRGREVLFRLEPPLRLTRRQAVRLVLLLAFPSMIVAVGWTLIGAWPVLPFTGFELGTVIAVLAILSRRQAWQEIYFSGEKIVVRDHLGTDHTFSRTWLQIRLQGQRFLIGSHGTWIEIGPFLPAGERRAVAAKLNRLLKEGE